MTKTQKALQTGPLERLYNGAAPAKILDFLLVFRDFDYSKQDIAKNSNVSFRHTLRELEKLEKLGLVKQTRTVGHSKMFKLNIENPAVGFLEKFATELAYRECLNVEAEQGKQMATVAQTV